MQTMRRIGIQINGKLVGSCDSISKVSSPLFKDILDPWFDIEGFVPAKPPLNENQLIVLKWLKSDNHPNYTNIFDLFSDLLEYQVPIEVGEAFTEMMTDKNQQFQVLAAFAEWGMKNE